MDYRCSQYGGFRKIHRAKKIGLCESAVLKDQTKEILNELNKKFKSTYNTTFTEQVKDCLQIEKPAAIVKLAKKNIEDQFEDTCVER